MIVLIFIVIHLLLWIAFRCAYIFCWTNWTFVVCCCCCCTHLATIATAWWIKLYTPFMYVIIYYSDCMVHQYAPICVRTKTSLNPFSQLFMQSEAKKTWHLCVMQVCLCSCFFVFSFFSIFSLFFYTLEWWIFSVMPLKTTEQIALGYWNKFRNAVDFLRRFWLSLQSLSIAKYAPLYLSGVFSLLNCT